MPKTLDEFVKQALGEQSWAILQLQAQLAAAQAKITELEGKDAMTAKSA